MLFKQASQNLRPSLHQQMKFNPAPHNPVTALCPTYPFKSHTQYLQQPGISPKRGPQPPGRSRSMQDDPGIPTPSSFPGRREELPGEAPPRRAKPGPASRGRGARRGSAPQNSSGRAPRCGGTEPGDEGQTGATG